MEVTQVIVDPMVNIYYAGFYIQALYELFGKRNVIFSAMPFKDFSENSRISILNFIIKKDETIIKYSLNFNDPYEINDELYNWCDVYGNVNANFELTPVHYHGKLIALPPSFGIRLWNISNAIYFAVSNIIKLNAKTSKKKFLGKYKRMQTLRLPYTEYKPSKSKNNYIFHLSTLWYNDEWNKNDIGVNLTRANFIRVCKSIESIHFEGGLVAQGQRSSTELFKDCLWKDWESMDSWLSKTKESTLVFNTPAFWNCHGWKLAEYLALGKAIISTPLINDLPKPLIHGENIHFVENDENKIKEAVLFIINNPEYRKKLERGARTYWETYGTPVKSLKLMGIY